jgi:HD-GYP domain-containing protein (c-di-GMP phosphodiesterase class II)
MGMRGNDKGDSSINQLWASMLKEQEKIPMFDQLKAKAEHVSAMQVLLAALDLKDSHTACHSQKVQEIAQVIAEGVGVDIGYAGLFHDVGKLIMPDPILQKLDLLTDDEYNIVKEHPRHGCRILLPLSAELARIVLMTHERPDGMGYPFGVREVPVEAGIVAVADTLHAILSDRPYRHRRSYDEAMAEIHAVSGSQLLPEVVAAVDRNEWRVKEVVRRLEPSAFSTMV